MNWCKLVNSAIIAGTVGFAFAPAQAGGDKVAFPENYAKGIKYLVSDKPQLKQVHEFFAMPPSFDAARQNQPMPSGTVLVREEYDVQLDAQGNPVKGPDGRLVKANLHGYGVMEKRAGWGSEYPPDLGNGEWEYQSFKPDKTPNEKAKLSACFGCHKGVASHDFVQSYDTLKKGGR